MTRPHLIVPLAALALLGACGAPLDEEPRVEVHVTVIEGPEADTGGAPDTGLAADTALPADTGLADPGAARLADPPPER